MSTATVFDSRIASDSRVTMLIAAAVVVLLGAGLLYTASELYEDLLVAPLHSGLPYLLLGVALLIALGFEFVNGFHDTANAVATVIYTHSLPPNLAVVWSGLFNFLGVLVSSGAVAFGIVSLLPVELILQVGTAAGFTMVFALLCAAIVWNLGTWYFGLPSSSSHTLIGSIIGVGLTNQLLTLHAHATSGVDWGQAIGVGQSLLLSPIIGFVAAALLLLVAKWLIPVPALYRAPDGPLPPPLWVRSLLVLTCTGVSFAHGSNDGQKGMGLIMLVLIGTVPTVYALNPDYTRDQIAEFAQLSRQAITVLDARDADGPAPANYHSLLTRYIQTRNKPPETMQALKLLAGHIADNVAYFGGLAKMPEEQTKNIRNDMYLASETLRFLLRSGGPDFTDAERSSLMHYRAALDNATKFIPLWVKVAVAMALGLGTMIGWKRIVVTVGEKIGKEHLTYGQGAAAEIVAMSTIAAADMFGLPVSTTHILSSGVAGTMAANGSGLQRSTVRSLILAWVLTLPVSIVLSGSLYALFNQLF
jgi:PiT family inorganic phosphate transporter